MKRNDSPSINNQVTKKSRTLPDERINRPKESDVICGRGRPYQEHPGNIRLHEIVAVHRSRYFDSKRSDKKGIAKMIVNSIKHDGTQPGRFLKRTGDDDDEGWEEVSLVDATAKVSHVLRFKSIRSSQPQMEAYTSKSGASGIPEANNHFSLQEFRSHPAGGQYTLEPRRQHSLEASWRNSRTLPKQSSRGALNVRRTLLNAQSDTIRWATVGTSMSGVLSAGTVETFFGGAPRNFSETSLGVKLLSDEQIFLLEALIQTRRAGTNTPGIAPAARFP